MNKTQLNVGVVLSFFVANISCGATTETSFRPSMEVITSIAIHGNQVEIKVRHNGGEKSFFLSVETEKKLWISVEDYNFDKHLDFSISHLDDGMGTYIISTIYIFSPKERKFVALSPACGDEFINIILSKKDRSLTNSYFSNNQLSTCIMKF